MTFATTSKLWRKYRCHSVCCYGKKQQGKHSNSLWKRVAFCSWSQAPSPSRTPFHSLAFADTQLWERYCSWVSHGARHLAGHSFTDPLSGPACLYFPGVISHKHSLPKHSYCTGDWHQLCSTTWLSNAPVSDASATFCSLLLLLLVWIEMIFTDFREICSDESTNIHSLKLLSWKIFLRLHSKATRHRHLVPLINGTEIPAFFPIKKQVKNKGHILSE